MSEIKIGDRVHARFPYCDGVAIGTVTAIERSAGATVYSVLVDEAETPSRTTAAWLVEVTTEMTAENLREALARCTEERDEARRERDEALKRIAELETAIKADGEASNSTMCAFWRVEDERDALTKERAEVAKERDLWRGLAGERYECLVQVIALRDAARKERDAARKETADACEQVRQAIKLCTEAQLERDALRRRAAQIADLLRAEGDEP